MKPARETPGQTVFAFTAQVLPRGDGSYVVTPGRPQEWLWLREAAQAAGMSAAGFRRWALSTANGGLVLRRVGRRKYQVSAESLAAALRPHNYLE